MQEEGRRCRPWLLWGARKWVCAGTGVLWSARQAERVLGNSREEDVIPLFPSFLLKLMLFFFQKDFFFLPPTRSYTDG